MDTILTRTGDAPLTQPPMQRTRAVKRGLRRLSAMAYAVLNRLTLPYRDLPSEYFRFPPF